MPARTTRIEETQIIKDILRQLRRHRANEISQEPIWTHDTFTAPATYQLTSIPYGINALADNGSVLSEGTDYTVDYSTGLITFAVGRTAGHVIFVSYVTNGDLIALSGPVDVGTLASDTFNRANSSTLGTASDGHSVWTDLTGGFGITSNQATVTSVGPSGGINVALSYIDVGVSDCQLLVTRIGANTGSGFAFRVVDNANYYYTTYNGVTKLVGGSAVAFASFTTPMTSGDKIRVTLSGLTITVETNTGGSFSTVASQTDGSFSPPMGTKHGLFADISGGYAFDDFSIT